MTFEAVIFDFDGTLVDSAAAKYESFFALFPAETSYRDVVAAVLERDPDGSRHEVIPRMLSAMLDRGLSLPEGHTADERVQAYGRLVFQAVRDAPEIPPASELLGSLSASARVYISSNTPQDAIEKLVELRGWRPMVEAVFGHPANKVEVVAQILARLGAAPSSVAVVGDGVSDETSARANGCAFFRVGRPGDLREIGRKLLAGYDSRLS